MLPQRKTCLIVSASRKTAINKPPDGDKIAGFILYTVLNSELRVYYSSERKSSEIQTSGSEITGVKNDQANRPSRNNCRMAVKTPASISIRKP